VLAIKRRRLTWIETTCYGVLRIIEPEADVNGVCGRKGGGWVKAENLIQQYRFYSHERRAEYIRLDVGLIPGQAEVDEGRIGAPVGQLGAVLDGKKIESQTRFYVLECKDKEVVPLTPNYNYSRLWRLA
jgi:hypothetical protein